MLDDVAVDDIILLIGLLDEDANDEKLTRLDEGIWDEEGLLEATDEALDDDAVLLGATDDEKSFELETKDEN